MELYALHPRPVLLGAVSCYVVAFCVAGMGTRPAAGVGPIYGHLHGGRPPKCHLRASELGGQPLLENYYLPGKLKASVGAFVEVLQLRPLPRNPRRRQLRPGPHHHREKEKDQEPDLPQTPLGPTQASSLTSTHNEPDPPLRNRFKCLKCFVDGHRIAALLRDDGWQVNDNRIEPLLWREWLKVPGKQPKRGRL